MMVLENESTRHIFYIRIDSVCVEEKVLSLLHYMKVHMLRFEGEMRENDGKVSLSGACVDVACVKNI